VNIDVPEKGATQTFCLHVNYQQAIAWSFQASAAVLESCGVFSLQFMHNICEKVQSRAIATVSR